MSEEANKCEEMSEEEIDQALEETFPASDPPSWTLGIEDNCEPASEQDSPKRELENQSES